MVWRGEPRRGATLLPPSRQRQVAAEAKGMLRERETISAISVLAFLLPPYLPLLPPNRVLFPLLLLLLLVLYYTITTLATTTTLAIPPPLLLSRKRNRGKAGNSVGAQFPRNFSWRTPRSRTRSPCAKTRENAVSRTKYEKERRRRVPACSYSRPLSSRGHSSSSFSSRSLLVPPTRGLTLSLFSPIFLSRHVRVCTLFLYLAPRTVRLREI